MPSLQIHCRLPSSYHHQQFYDRVSSEEVAGPGVILKKSAQAHAQAQVLPRLKLYMTHSTAVRQVYTKDGAGPTRQYHSALQCLLLSLTTQKKSKTKSLSERQERTTMAGAEYFLLRTPLDIDLDMFVGG
mmetsp:Transcript_3133/g.6806  ORF Transcript_3133/g.6806 Transcript_3133/m.6806 type:complete len:130 (-) Transcript_3133:114-503(-)